MLQYRPTHNIRAIIALKLLTKFQGFSLYLMMTYGRQTDIHNLYYNFNYTQHKFLKKTRVLALSIEAMFIFGWRRALTL
jgi:hypothetical protein